MKKKILLASFGLFVLSFFSKILGFLKEILIAYFYGASSITDAYSVSQNVINLLFSSITTAVVISYITNFSNKGNNEKPLNKSITFFSCLFIIFSILIFVFSKQIVFMFAPGFSSDTAVITSNMIRIIAPFCVFNSVLFLCSAELQTKNIFWHIGVYNLIANIVIILSVIFSHGSYKILAFGYGVSFLIEALFVAVVVKKIGHKFKPYFSFEDNNLKKIFNLAYPIFFVELFSLLLQLIDKIFASNMGEGIISSINYANRLVTLSLTFFVSIISTVLLPTLVVKAQKKQYEEYRKTSMDIYIYILVLVLPITFFVSVFSKSIVKFLFFRGAFDFKALNITSSLLRIYMMALPGLSLISIVKNQLYSLEKNKYTFGCTFVSVLINVLLDFIFVKYFGYYGLAYASILSTYLLMTLLLISLKKTIGKIINKGFIIEVLKLFVSVILSSIIAYYITHLLLINNYLILLIISGLTFVVFYLCLLKLFRFEELSYVLNVLKEKLFRRKNEKKLVKKN